MLTLIYKAIYKLLDFFIGKTLRLFQKMLVEKKQHASITDLVSINARRESADYAIKNFQKAMIFDTKKKLWDFAIKSIKENNQPISKSPQNRKNPIDSKKIIAEFGVWKGESINYFANHLPEFQVYGFDSFEGLEEDWYGSYLTRNSFDRNRKIPKVAKNVEISIGWFENTIDDFCSKIDGKFISLLHLDADTFKPTKLVLNKLKFNLGPGTIIIFDEYFGYPNWRLHEYKAFKEFCVKNKIKFEYIAYSNNQVAVKIK
jgi:hypothetical protein